jgi:hypothetical protein
MGFVWSAVGVGDIIEYDPALLEMRTNADWLNDNPPACIVDDVTIYTSYCYSYESAKNNAADGAYNAGVDGAHMSKNV